NSEASFLNHTKILNLPHDWNDELPSKLWVYNLHYFEDLLSVNAFDRKFFLTKLLNQWVSDNSDSSGNAWEAYPSSLRIVNVLKAWLGGLDIDQKIFNSLYLQTSYLSNNIERHLLGNHLFVNLKALLFSGVVFDNKNWLEISESGLIAEIPEQILKDGANFELSPMYHSLMLVDMLDMLNLSRAYPQHVSPELVILLEMYIPKMLKFMSDIAHPDGHLAFFNDSANGIAPINSKIIEYAQELDFFISPLDENQAHLLDYPNSGYFCASMDGSKLIFDAAAVGASYIPGHAHADTLSFEMSIGIERVFVNTGTSEYGLTQNRINQRKTRSHNTVEVDGLDSSKVWSNFRVGNRASISNRKSQIIKNQISMQATHDGYKKFFGGCLHTRKILMTPKSIVINDILDGNFKVAKSRFFIHPDLSVSIRADILQIKGSKFVMRSNLKGKSVAILDSCWHPEFGVSVANKFLEIDFKNNQSEIIFTWHIN
ncbi:heparinase II/III family protein, partial [Gammaproteobacteria bacterium]|nr:heparinase II/III family protein [Gammaproteobacteria bacterium]